MVIKVLGNIIAGVFNGLTCIIEEFATPVAILENFLYNNVLFYCAINTLRHEESLGKSVSIMYVHGYYAALDNEEGFYYVTFLEGKALLRFRKWIKEFISRKKIIPDGS